MLQETWFSRELPVLTAVVEAFERDFDSCPMWGISLGRPACLLTTLLGR